MLFQILLLADAQLPAKDFLSHKYVPGKVLRINLDFLK
ncbi:Uncharacterised protein [Sphingobacterium daejeonense]|nr:Uncharacterised protein [Sphingobacterium daejeonense]